mgnify:CR=1 FL=1
MTTAIEVHDPGESSMFTLEEIDQFTMKQGLDLFRGHLRLIGDGHLRRLRQDQMGLNFQRFQSLEHFYAVDRP